MARYGTVHKPSRLTLTAELYTNLANSIPPFGAGADHMAWTGSEPCRGARQPFTPGLVCVVSRGGGTFRRCWNRQETYAIRRRRNPPARLEQRSDWQAHGSPQRLWRYRIAPGRKPARSSLSVSRMARMGPGQGVAKARV